jgi:hypothetical protein
MAVLGCGRGDFAAREIVGRANSYASPLDLGFGRSNGHLVLGSAGGALHVAVREGSPREGWTAVTRGDPRRRDAPDFVELGEAGIAVDHVMRRQRRVQLVG